MKIQNFESNWIFELNEEDNFLNIIETYNNGDKLQEVTLSLAAYKALLDFVKIKEVFSE